MTHFFGSVDFCVDEVNNKDVWRFLLFKKGFRFR